MNRVSSIAILMAALLAPAAAHAQVAPEAAPPEQTPTPAADPATAEAPAPDTDRQRPGLPRAYPERTIQSNEGAVRSPPPEAFPVDHLPTPDRWRVVENFGAVTRWFDPYNQNTLKGDRPIGEHRDWFIAVTAISDSVLEPRSFPIPVGVQTTQNPGANDTFGRANSTVASQTFIGGIAFIQGSTAFKPPELEVRLALALNYSYVEVPERRVLSVLPSRRPERSDSFLGVQEAFVDYHLRNVSDRYDFDSLRVGIQPFSTDFRGFLFQDNQLGIRLFGNRDNNRIQYNLAAFVRLEKDTNSGLNDVSQSLRDDYIFIANIYHQDMPVPGMTSQVTLVYNVNRERGQIHVDDNGFPVRPALIGNLRTRDYDVAYFGYNGDGHFGRFNLTASAYGAVGEDRNSIFTNQPADIRAWFAAAEPSYDMDWVRIRLSGVYASGDEDPYDDTETGFDAIFENPLIAGADTSYWIRQSIPFAGGGRAVAISGRNGLLNSLRSSKEEGQSNFNNPGTVLLGAGADFDVTPEMRVSVNLNRLWFADTTIVQTLRQEGSIPTDLGWDYSASAIWRPWMTQNVIFRASAAVFEPGDGFGDLFTNRDRDDRYYSILLNAVLTF